MKILLSKIAAWIQYQFTYIFDVINFYYVTDKTRQTNGSKIIEYQISHMNLTKVEAYEKRLDSINDKMKRLILYDICKKALLFLLLICISTFIFSIISESLPEKSIIFTRISFWSFFFCSPLLIFAFFDKSKLEKELSGYKSIFIELLSQSNSNIPNKTTSSTGDKITSIMVDNPVPIGVLHYLLAFKAKSSNFTATRFGKTVCKIFTKSDGDHYKLRSLGNEFSMTKAKKDTWSNYNQFIVRINADILKREGNAKQKEETPLSKSYTNLIFSHIINSDLGIQISEAELKILIKMYCHIILLGQEGLLKLSEDEYFLLKKLYENKLNIYSREERQMKVEE